MKTTIEMYGYEITVSVADEKLLVQALKDGEVMEEFELEGDDSDNNSSRPSNMGDEDMGDEDMAAFGEEEDDLGDEDDEVDVDTSSDDEEEMKGDNGTLESFSMYVNKLKRNKNRR